MRCATQTTVIALGLVGLLQSASAAEPAQVDYQSQIAPIFTKYCVGCHNETDVEGGLSLESFAQLQEGGTEGPAVLPGQSASSRMIRMLTGELEPRMPPADADPPVRPPKPEEIALLREWIDGGAHGPDGEELEPVLVTPFVPTKEGVAEPITAIAISPDGGKLAVGRFERLEIL